MKKTRMLSFLIGVMAMALTSCEDLVEKKAYCLESSDEISYVEGTCCQISPTDVLENIYLVNPAISVDENNQAKYDIEWKYNIPLSHFTFTDGLEGKKVDKILTLSENVVRLIVYGAVINKDATFGYIKVSKEAFVAKSARTRDAFLYACVAIGDTYGQIDKPVLDN